MPSGTVDVPVHRSRGLDAVVGAASRRDAPRARASRRMLREPIEATAASWSRRPATVCTRRSRPVMRRSLPRSPAQRRAGAEPWPDERAGAGAYRCAHGCGGATRRGLFRYGGESGGAVDGGRARRAGRVFAIDRGARRRAVPRSVRSWVSIGSGIWRRRSRCSRLVTGCSRRCGRLMGADELAGSARS